MGNFLGLYALWDALAAALIHDKIYYAGKVVLKFPDRLNFRV